MDLGIMFSYVGQLITQWMEFEFTAFGITLTVYKVFIFTIMTIIAIRFLHHMSV